MSQTQSQPLHFDDQAAFFAWAEQQGGRWEREDGLVVQAMAPERLNHSRIKARVWSELATALDRAGLRCEAFVDGPTVSIDANTDYVPDVVVSCDKGMDGGGMTVTNPVIVVEVLSPSTSDRDFGVKLNDYFRRSSVQHYLIFAADTMRVVHHQRWTEGRLLTRLHHGGTIDLNPPGIGLAVADCYRGTGLPGAP